MRAARTDDYKPLAGIRAKEAVGAHTGGPKSAQDVWFILLNMPGMWSLLGYGYWLVELRETGALVGEVGFGDFMRGMTPDLSGAPEAGWIIDTPFWGQGLTTEAAIAAHHWLDTETDFTRSTCIIEPDHAPSINVAHKLGYKELGISKYKEDDVMIFERQS